MSESAPSDKESRNAYEVADACRAFNEKHGFKDDPDEPCDAVQILARHARALEARLAEAVESAGTFEMAWFAEKGRAKKLEARLAEAERESEKWKGREAGMAKNHLDELELRTSIELEVESLRINLAAMTKERDESLSRVAELNGDIERLAKRFHESEMWQSKYRKLQSETQVALFASREREARMREALIESLALNKNWVADAEPETLAYYSEYRAVIKQGDAALSPSGPGGRKEP